MMQVKASLNNVRMAPRKVRLVANLIKGLSTARAKAQLTFLVKKPAPLILKLVNSAVANAKHDFEIEENDLFIKSIVVEAGATLRRWLPRAMGRASAIRKRTCRVKLILDEVKPGSVKKRKIIKPEVLEKEEVAQEVDRREEKTKVLVKEAGPKGVPPAKPHSASSEAKYKNFSRQTIGNIKKVFRRKSI
ncbi:50S ribosomal protein L22 [Patescibacteria group bacterium]|nr:50S ribosomal protein L22 [Patescibacteria group bacterium]MBU2220012.1 50S ribosomal protein L22 [Patescibacteria group bacterium]MBU2264573.1 50S ribosomal protein L22 [Patescibacteria group bacterium]